jgi:hypothetical protein
MYDPLDNRGVPVIWNAPYGHMWPANKTLRVPLSGNGT